jgi:hypothetical protein
VSALAVADPGPIERSVGGRVLPASLVTVGASTLCLVALEGEDRLAVITDRSSPQHDGFHGIGQELPDGGYLRDCPLDSGNAAALRRAVPWLRPTPLGPRASFGFGDRLGLATPGHVAALRSARAGMRIAPVLAQQSMREMVRSARQPWDVVDAATWGALASGWRGPFGADADHLTTIEEVDACVGHFTTFTLDPKAVVEPAADTAGASALEQAVRMAPWDVLESTPSDTFRRYVGAGLDLQRRVLSLTEDDVARAIAKYGRAIAHVVAQYRYLSARATDFEVEVAVDETTSPTSPGEHLYMASELHRLGVAFVSFAPRLVGELEKGIGYRGDLARLREDLEAHAAVSRSGRPYKLSVHSGSDKFEIYPILAEATGGAFHLKTSGTSYLEALGVISSREPDLFRRICAVAARSFAADRASYFVSPPVGVLEPVASLPDSELPAVLRADAERQVLHVTYGSVLAELGDGLRAALRRHRNLYATRLEEHLARHLEPLTRQGAPDR